MSYDPLVSPAVDSSTPAPDTYWHATSQPTSFEALDGAHDTDFLIIGGGYTGLSAALELTEKQSGRVTLIDSHSMGFGCAGRNAGFVLSGSGRLGPLALAKKFGPATARAIQNEYDEAVTQLLQHIETYDIACDVAPGPYYKLAHTAGQARSQTNSLDQLAGQFGSQATALDRHALQQQLSVKGFYGATVQPGYGLNPLKLADGLACAARDSGAQLFGQTPALKLDHNQAGYTVWTPTGRINATKVLIASNAYSSKQFHPCIDSRQFPVQSSILVTEPLSDGELASIGLNAPATMMDTRMMKYYYRLLPDNRILFGGRGEVTGKAASAGKARLFNAMVSSFPVLNHKPVSHFWSGWVSVSLDSLPRVYFDHTQNLGYAMGYCGAGVSFANFAGRRLAQQAMGDTDLPDIPLYTSPLPRYPLAGLRRLGLRALYAWARVAERV
ncbi:FAD-binding oxidoreductase [Salinimonas marina]|uniref:FAD-binding oxidoreductase n=1 Tax=Salinimonas marina TaxID=2785918 RepID=A0A7S9DYI6_9ALTE|nr:FAD-binding oxidoreductase [Salinimonas marina]QPG06218.1 FAD-binding oxidoreductase [Salinimonas marina]